MLNTISDHTYRMKYRLASLDKALRNALVAEKICAVDRSDVKTIESPYGSAPTTVLNTICGTYATAAFTTTDATLTVDHEFNVAEHIYDFEQVLTNFDVFNSRLDEQNYSVATAIDKFVLNDLLDVCTSTYTTPAGGFTTAANVNVILANLLSKVAGYADSYKGVCLVLENTDLTGLIQAQMTNGYSFADAALNNGLVTHQAGIDIYVVRTGTFATYSPGNRVFTNLGHRYFGVKGISTYASPRGIKYEEKMVTGKTGKETVTYGYIGHKLWAPKLLLGVDITIA